MRRFDWSSFFPNILSVVLGIFITFGIQGMIDRRHEKKEVSSALELVLEELNSNKSDLQEVIGLVGMELDAAKFMLDNPIFDNMLYCFAIHETSAIYPEYL